MDHPAANRRKRARTAAVLVMLAGLSISALVYLRAEGDPHSGISGEFALEESMRDSKRYVHDLEIYGGKANVIASDFIRWFSGLWEGTQLAFTIAAITVAISIAILVFDNIFNIDQHSSDTNGGKS